VGKTRKERKKAQQLIDDKRSHLKVLLKYLDKDYAHIKKRCVTISLTVDDNDDDDTGR
jgi:hypothetical protein